MNELNGASAKLLVPFFHRYEAELQALREEEDAHGQNGDW